MSAPIPVQDEDIKAAAVHIDHVDGGHVEKRDMAEGHEELEKNLTLLQNLKLYRKVRQWSLIN